MIHVVVGTLCFLVVFGAALLTSSTVKSAEGVTPGWMHEAVAYAEMMLFGLDLLCFALFVISETIGLGSDLWRE